MLADVDVWWSAMLNDVVHARYRHAITFSLLRTTYETLEETIRIPRETKRGVS